MGQCKCLNGTWCQRCGLTCNFDNETRTVTQLKLQVNCPHKVYNCNPKDREGKCNRAEQCESERKEEWIKNNLFIVQDEVVKFMQQYKDKLVVNDISDLISIATIGLMKSYPNIVPQFSIQRELNAYFIRRSDASSD